MTRLICIKNPAIIISAPDELVSEVGGNCWQVGGPQPVTYPKHLWEKENQPSLPSNLDEAANNYGRDIRLGYPRVMDETDKYICNAFKAGAEWYDNQMKMPNSSELISAWRGVKSILQEKDFRGDEWRLAYNAFMFGFSRGINTQKTEK